MTDYSLWKMKVLELLYRAGARRDFLFRFVFYAVESRFVTGMAEVKILLKTLLN